MDGKTKILGVIFALIGGFAAYNYISTQADLNHRAENAKYQATDKRPDITMTRIAKPGAAQATAPTSAAATASSPNAQAAPTCPPVGDSYLSLRTAEDLFRFNLRPDLKSTSPALAKFIGANLKTTVVKSAKEEPTDSIYSLNQNLITLVENMQALKKDAQTFNCLEWYLVNAADTETCTQLASAQRLSVVSDAHGVCIVGTLADVHVYRTPGTATLPIATATAQVQQR